jgi:hypothetical protein
MISRDPNGEHWTLGTLRLYLEALITGIKDTVKALADRCDDKFVAIEKAVAAALAAADRATTKAEAASDKRFEGVNEFRKSLDDNNRLQMPRLETEALVKGLRERIEKLETRKEAESGRTAGIKDSAAIVVSIISLLATIIMGAFYLAHFGSRP